MKCRLDIVVAVALCCALAGLSAATADVNWPATNAGWHPLTIGGGLYTDPDDITPGWVDIRGGTDDNANDYTAGYWYYDGTDVMFRMRVDLPKANPQVVWQILVDIDNDDFVDYSLQTDYSSDELVEFYAALVGGPTFAEVVLDDGTALWSDAHPSLYDRFVDPTGDGSLFDGEADTFVDIAMPWSQFASITGIQGQTFRVALATSADDNNINKDLPTAWSDAFVLPEPGTMALLSIGLFGIGARLRRRREA